MARQKVRDTEKCVRKDISMKPEQYDRLLDYCGRTERSISWVIRKALDEYLFRKTTATQIILRGGSDEIAGEYLGHAPNSVTSKHYTFKGPEHIREIFNKYVRQ